MTDITANVIVSMPSQLFTMARSFKAVANGKIYIGKIDTDPVNPENQIQVYVENEDGSHVPVSQPIIINAAGYPVYNGQIAKFVTVQGHSMAVYDSYGAQQFYFPNVLKYDPDQFTNRLADVYGSTLVGGAYFSDIRTYSEKSKKIYCLGRSGLFDGGEGWFYLDDADTTSDDDDGIILVGASGRRWKRVIEGSYKPEWWGADPTDTVDCHAAFTKCIAAARGKEISLSGKYKFSKPLVIDFNDEASLKITGTGSYNHMANAKTKNLCYLNFDSIPQNSRAITFKGVRGLVLEDFHVSHRAGGSSLSVALWLTKIDDFRLTGLTVDSDTGPGGQGIRFGESNGTDCAFMGNISHCKVWMHGGGPSFCVQPACTSLLFENCYGIGGYFYFQNCVYCSMNTCASEGSEVSGYGYILHSVEGFTAINCAGEGNKLGVFYLSTGCSQVVLTSPYGAGNGNLTGDIDGALVKLDGTSGANSNILIENPVSHSQVGNVTSDINAVGVNGHTEITNVYSAKLTKGIAGSDSWIQNYLTITGDLSCRDFIPGIPGWTAPGGASAEGKFTRNNKMVSFSVKVSPTSTLSCAQGTSKTTLPSFGGLLYGGAAQISDTAGTSYGSAMIDTNGVVWMPTITSTANAILISGSVLTN